jgi:hypothetical protein
VQLTASEQQHRDQDEPTTQQGDRAEGLAIEQRSQQNCDDRLEVESIEALVGPIRLSPARNVATGMTVAMRVISAMASQPAGVTGQCGPLIAVNAAYTMPAEAKITVED